MCISLLSGQILDNNFPQCNNSILIYIDWLKRVRSTKSHLKAWTYPYYYCLNNSTLTLVHLNGFIYLFDALDNFVFIKTHILQGCSHSDVSDISVISTDRGGHVLWVNRLDKNDSGNRISSAWSFYEFQKTDAEWKISSITSLPSLRSPF